MKTRENISSGTKWETEVGYSRAVKVGDQIYVSGTTAIDSEGKIVGENDVYAQTKYIIQKIAFTLRELGAGLNNVVRTRIFVVNIDDWELIGKAHGEFFSEIKPAATMVEVSKLINEKLLVEIEMDAVIENKLFQKENR